ncbi:helix-turn-helix domain-containing protein [Myroides sp. LJL116]
MGHIKVFKLDDLAKNSLDQGFYVDTIVNHLANNHAHLQKPHRHNFYVCLFFTQGSGTHTIDFTTYDITPGSVFMLGPGQMHSWDLSKDIDGYVLFHTQDFLDVYFVRNSVREYPVFSSLYCSYGFVSQEEQMKELKMLFQNMIKEFSLGLWKDHLMLVNWISIFYISCNRTILQGKQYKESSNNVYYTHFIEFENMVEIYFREDKFAQQYAQRLNMTQKHLNRICRTLINKTTTQIILERLILEAKRELIYSEKSLATIALDLGYEDYSYFSKVFKKQEGITPREFQKKYE